MKYGGPETIAQKNGYIRAHARGTYSGFGAAERIAQAEEYFAKWYGQGEPVTVETVKTVIRENPEWKPKLQREVFSDSSISRAIVSVQELFPEP